MQDRRKFIKTIGRGILLSGLTFLGGYLMLKTPKPASEDCNFDFVCNNCKKLSSCSLPEARKHKEKSPTK